MKVTQCYDKKNTFNIPVQKTILNLNATITDIQYIKFKKRQQHLIK